MNRNVASIIVVILAVAVVFGVRLARPTQGKVSFEPSKTKGAPSPKVTLLEFSDFECPYCAKIQPVLDQLLADFPNDLAIAFKHYPLRIHPNAPIAAEAAECAGDQGRFFAFHDVLFDKADEWGQAVEDLTPTYAFMKQYAADLRLDVEKFSECLDSGLHKATVQRNKEEAEGFLVGGTPSLILNSRKIVTSNDYDKLKEMISEEIQRLGS